MRTVGILVSVALMLGSFGCKNNGEAEAAPDPAAVKAQQELVARRDALLAQKEKLQGEATKISEEIKKVEATGGDTSELAKKKAELETQIVQQDDNLSSTSSELTAITSKLDAAGGVVVREARVADREKAIAAREAQFSQREREFQQAQLNAAKQWKDSCAVGGTSTTVIQQVAPPKSGNNYTRKEVDGLLGKAKSQMAKKGLINSDLGAQASLEGEITKALSESDWTRGYILANQLVQTIDAIQINRNFIKAKYERLNSRVSAAKVDEATQGQLDSGMKEIMQKWGDGDFIAANKRINALYGALR
ncbi:MAG: hypothetical protein H0T42_10910 [Deltaproteobacteria bacterium]|nr:hypothetical protein [Deltaproteobacteria bacterium]